VIVGAGLAGMKTVEALRAGEYAGTITMVGSEKHQPYDRPPLSKQVLRGDREAVYLYQPDLVDLDVEIRTSVTATSLDERAVVLDTGERLAFDHAVIATGAKVRTLPDVPQIGGVFFLRTLDDALALRAAVSNGTRTVVIGGGFIGCEVAASLRSMGAEVTIVEPLDAPLVVPLGPELAAELVAVHEQHGVTVRAGRSVRGLTGGDRVTGVILDDGSVLEADVVVVGVGVLPDTDWLEGSGVTVDNGVVVDATLATSVPRVWAVGDVARWWDERQGAQVRAEHWTNATEMAEVAAANILGGHVQHAPVPYFWSDQYDVKIQSLGWTTGSDERRLLRAGPKERRIVLYGREGRLWGVTGLNAPALVRRLHPQIGEHVPLDEAAGALT
jgi:3-phenylpropionate/trans-cinnamate dioxygenase ferredoxin reductase subunit